MNYAIGVRIKELRTKHQVSQEQMAEALCMTRQRYARLEKGQVDISYLLIKKIADYMGIPIREITSVEQENRELVTYFREKDSFSDVLDSVAKVQEILHCFHAHEKLYNKIREREESVDR
jgi:transcriptional regulator with XRE-family HTH domain